MPSASTSVALPSVVGLQDLRTALKTWFAPWIQDLGLSVESCEGGAVTLRLPFTDDLCRVGGMVCGQALMAAADTAMALAVASQLGTRQAMTTVQFNASFLKPLASQDALVTARVIRAGESLVFGEIDAVAAKDGKSVCRATATYALL